MQVLVALGLEPGQVLSRDDLIALCWEGRIVGDNAVNRVISLLRQALAEVTDGAVRLETITKVGFRIVEDANDTPIPPAIQTAGTSRRTASLVVAGAIFALGGAAAWAGRDSIFGQQRNPNVVSLIERARLIQLTGEPGTSQQAISFYEQAAGIDPDDADAWGHLAFAHLLAFSGFSGRDMVSFREKMIAAARQGLTLDPTQPEADAALSFSNPAFGAYARFDAETTGLLKRHPGFWYSYARRAMFLRDVGRLRESLPFGARSIEIDPMLPVGWGNVASTHSLLGDYHVSDSLFDKAAERWPAHSYLWTQRFHVLLEAGRYEEAAVLARDPRSRPDYIPREVGEKRAELALALREQDAFALGAFRAQLLGEVQSNLLIAQAHAPTLAVMGFVDDALDILSRLFVAALKSKTIALQVATICLFRPAFDQVRSDERYIGLLKTSGLEEYWRISGSQPDFRRS